MQFKLRQHFKYFFFGENLAAHDQPATSRFGIVNGSNLHRNPDEPGPNYYDPRPMTGYRIDYRKR